MTLFVFIIKALPGLAKSYRMTLVYNSALIDPL